MSVPVLTFFNNKGGVGKTALVYHLSWMLAEQGVRILAVDLDPQANLTAAFLDEDELDGLWRNQQEITTIFRSIKPLLSVGDFAPADYRSIHPNLALIPGDLELSGFEDELSSTWDKASADSHQDRAFYVLTAFWRVAQDAAKRHQADLIVFDVGPNLGAINRSALLASNQVVVPLGADLFSLQGLRNLGPTLRKWREGWQKRCSQFKPSFAIPLGDMQPLGYIAMRHGVRMTRPVKAYTRWLEKIPSEFRDSVLDESDTQIPNIEADPYCLAMLKNYNSLMPLAQEHRKPIFSLTVADGAIGAHAAAVESAYVDFRSLALEIYNRIKPGQDIFVKTWV